MPGNWESLKWNCIVIEANSLHTIYKYSTLNVSTYGLLPMINAYATSIWSCSVKSDKSFARLLSFKDLMSATSARFFLSARAFSALPFCPNGLFAGISLSTRHRCCRQYCNIYIILVMFEFVNSYKKSLRWMEAFLHLMINALRIVLACVLNGDHISFVLFRENHVSKTLLFSVLIEDQRDRQ